MSNEKIKISELPSENPVSGDFIAGIHYNTNQTIVTTKFPFDSFSAAIKQLVGEPVLAILTVDASTGADFFCVLKENITLDLPINLVNGRTYTFVFEQASTNATVTFGVNVNDVKGVWSMVNGNGNFAIVQFYCTYDRLYLTNYLPVT